MSELFPEVHVLFFSCCGRWYHSLHRPSCGGWARLGPKNKVFAGIQDYNQGQFISALMPTLHIAGPLTSAAHVVAVIAGWNLSF